MRTIPLLCSAAILVLLSVAATAQSNPPPGGIVGNWTITRVGGEPIQPGITATHEVTQGDGGITGKVYINNGSGKQLVPNETIEYTPVGEDLRYYTWFNPAKQTSGSAVWDAFEGVYVTTGPNGSRWLIPSD